MTGWRAVHKALSERVTAVNAAQREWNQAQIELNKAIIRRLAQLENRKT